MPALKQCIVPLLLSFSTLAEVLQVKNPSPSLPLELVLFRDHHGSCTVRSLTHTQPHRLLSTLNDVVVNSLPLSFDLQGTRPVPLEKLQLIGHASGILWSRARSLCSNLFGADHPTATADQHVIFSPFENETLDSPVDVYPLLVSGPSVNRVDLTFFSDGYTVDERDKFFADARRLALDISQNRTFTAVLPLMNIWAAFVPSRESGIGVGGTPKDTAFGLYRDGTELRAVYCSKEDIARNACLNLRSRCDYPILLGNDELYGGLGGEFTISTSSEANGALVLRHELGHSIIGVGEEYDGGYAYFGVNSAQNISSNSPLPWSHWLSPSSTIGGIPRTERSVMDFQSYPWTMLNKTSPWSAIFSSSGLYSRFLVRFSLSGLPKKEDLSVTLDGRDLGWEPRPDIKLDRWHYDILRDEALKPGSHEISFNLGTDAIEGKAQLCSVEIIEYGSEDEFNSTAGYYGAFPTFSNVNATTFRPTNEQCLMRRVTSADFCNACLEGLWMSLLSRVSIIDAFTITTSESGRTTMDLTLVPFGQFRRNRMAGEVYSIVWKQNGVELPAFGNMTTVVLEGDARGRWQADVQLYTVDVRADPNGLLKETASVEMMDDLVPKPVIDRRICE